MQLKIKYLGTTFLVLLLSSQFCSADIIHNEQAVEAVEFQYNLIGNDSGTIIAKQCKECQSVRLNITSKTKAYSDGSLVSLKSVPIKSKVAVTVIYDPKTMNANKILY